MQCYLGATLKTLNLLKSKLRKRSPLGRVALQGVAKPLASVALHFDTKPSCREEHSMDQCQSRQKLSENFEHHWSIPFPGKFVWTNDPEISSKVSPCTGIGPRMALPSLVRFS